MIESPESERGKSSTENGWRSKWEADWRTAIRQDVDSAIAASLTWRQFVKALEDRAMNFGCSASIRP